MSALGLLQHLSGCARPDVSMTAHKEAKFSNDPKACHDKVVIRISKFLLGTSNESLTHEPNEDKSLE